MYQLYIANRNYSSWSMRPWVLMRELGIRFEEHLKVFDANTNFGEFRKFSPTGRVPCLVDGTTTVWDSLAITEYLAERHDGVWPKDPVARAWARSASAEMHSGFGVLRDRCTMNLGLRIRLRNVTAALTRDVERVGEVWLDGLKRFRGPYLAGAKFSAVDAFYVPVAFRAQTYGLELPAQAMAYAERLRKLPSSEEWYAAALREPWRDPPHDEEARQTGDWLQDLRAPSA